MRLLRVVHHQFDVLRAVYTHGNGTAQRASHWQLLPNKEVSKKNKIDKLK